jgi:hypothetical protein
MENSQQQPQNNINKNTFSLSLSPRYVPRIYYTRDIYKMTTMQTSNIQVCNFNCGRIFDRTQLGYPIPEPRKDVVSDQNLH